MSDLLEQSLREIYAEDAAGYDTTDAAQRLSTFDYRSRVTRRRRIWAAAGASGAALSGGVVTAILVLSGAPAAYAGWTYAPSVATPAAVAAATAKCNQLSVSGQPQPGASDYIFSGRPVLTEARGIYTALITINSGQIYDCLYSGDGISSDSGAELRDIVTLAEFGPVQTAPGPDQLTAPNITDGGLSSAQGGWPGSVMSSTQAQAYRDLFSDGGYGYYALGQAGKDISAVTFAFQNHAPVQATVENGWYFAWWPWIGEPTSVQVTTTSGILTSPMTSSQPGTPTPEPGCRPGTNGCVFSTATITPPATTTSTTTITTPGTSTAGVTTSTAATTPTTPATTTAAGTTSVTTPTATTTAP